MGKFVDYAEVGDYWPKEHALETIDILDRFTSRKFHDMMDDRMLVSHFKYGDSRDGYPEKLSALDQLQRRLEMYLNTLNAEYLVDMANYCMLEFMHPSLEGVFLKATDSDGSPGHILKDGQVTQKPHKEH